MQKIRCNCRYFFRGLELFGIIIDVVRTTLTATLDIKEGIMGAFEIVVGISLALVVSWQHFMGQ
jgi:hypothetical protein